ncbi:MAG: Ig-like domain-containing protein [Firmicutes bacterium]|nr:Ig-like domain-containing protein [Bacillota bacterium]
MSFTSKEAAAATGVSLDKTTSSIIYNATDSLTATLTGSPTLASVRWVSSNPAVATITSTGNLAATVQSVASGTTTITASPNDGTAYSATCTVTVTVRVTSITLNKTSTLLYPGNTETLTATVLPSGATNKVVNWASSAPSVATVGLTTGLVTAVATGSTNITATATDGSGIVSDTCVVTVGIRVTSITLNKTSTTISTGNTETLTATVLPANATNKVVTWASSATGVATVNSSTGLITAVSVGTTNITATATDGSGIVSNTCVVTVVVLVTSITLNKSSTTIYIGKTETLTVTVLPSGATNKSVTWSSDATGVATVNSSSGLVTAVSAGTANIKATAQDGSGVVSGTCVVTVPTVAVEADAYAAGFLSDTSVCDPTGVNNNMTAIWSSLATKYGNMSGGAKDYFYNDSSSGTNIAHAKARYHFIIVKYPTLKASNNFMKNNAGTPLYPANDNSILPIITNDKSLMMILLISALGIASMLSYFYLSRKHKHE